MSPQSHYSLRWNNHQSHILSAFDALLQAETLVDVTLVCAETSVRAHKVVLSACSPFFQRIFSENPCKHPVIVLKDFSGWEVQAIVDFMYKGEISVIQEQLQSLIKAAESLQVRGLANQDHFNLDHHHRSPSPPGFYGSTPGAESSPFSPPPPPPLSAPTNFEHPMKLPHMTLNFPDVTHPSSYNNNNNSRPLLSEHPRPESPSLIPRRKQARPRRRSGELCAPQDLSSKPQTPPPASLSSASSLLSIAAAAAAAAPNNGEAENLCMKKSKPNDQQKQSENKRQQSLLHQMNECEERSCSQVPITSPAPSASSPELDLSMHHHKEYPPSPPSAPPASCNLLPPTMLNLKHEMDSHSPFPPMPSVSALAMTPPHSKFFGLDSPLLFPPGLDGCRNPLLELADPRSNPDTPIFSKKKSKSRMGRPKGQHSAPRGGPPRSWTNAELTEALQHVWNKKMTTSQASRIFGIPYNSLLMYVRGKYGKSLKLEQLRKDCIGGPGGVDLLNLGGNNNNNSCKSSSGGGVGELDPQRPSSADDHMQQPPPPHQSLFNPFAPNFYPDFGGGGFPIPVSMIHLLPQSEKNHFLAAGNGAGGLLMDEDCNRNSRGGSVKDEPQDLFMAPSMSVDRRELVQQNGQD